MALKKNLKRNLWKEFIFNMTLSALEKFYSL